MSFQSADNRSPYQNDSAFVICLLVGFVVLLALAGVDPVHSTKYPVEFPRAAL